MSLIYMTTTTSNSVSANGIIPLTTIARRKGCACQGGSNLVILTKPGYYKINGSVTLTGSAGNAIITLYKNGTSIPAISSTETITTADTEYRTLNFNGIIRVFCNELNTSLTLVSSTAITQTNVSLDVEYLG